MTTEPPIWKLLIEKLHELKLQMPCGLTKHAAIDDCITIVCQYQADAVCPYVITSDEGTSYCRLAQENGPSPSPTFSGSKEAIDWLKQQPDSPPDIVMSDDAVERVAKAFYGAQYEYFKKYYGEADKLDNFYNPVRAAIKAMGEGMPPKALKASDAGLGVISASASPVNIGDASTRKDEERELEPRTLVNLPERSSPASDSMGSPIRYTDGSVSREYEEQPAALSGYSEDIQRFKRKLADSTPEEGKFYRLTIDVVRDGNEIFVADELVPDELITEPEKASGYMALDPDMPTQELRLHMGELTNDEVLVARAAIQWANSCKGGYPVGTSLVEALEELEVIIKPNDSDDAMSYAATRNSVLNEAIAVARQDRFNPDMGDAPVSTVLQEADHNQPSPASSFCSEHTVRSPCNWSGGNDYLACSTCHQEYQYQKGESRPACPYAQQREMRYDDWNEADVQYVIQCAIYDSDGVNESDAILAAIRPYLRIPVPEIPLSDEAELVELLEKGFEEAGFSGEQTLAYTALRCLGPYLRTTEPVNEPQLRQAIGSAMSSSKQLGMTGYTDQATDAIMNLVRPYLRSPEPKTTGEIPLVDESTLFNKIGFGLMTAIADDAPALEIAEWIMKIIRPYLRTTDLLRKCDHEKTFHHPYLTNAQLDDIHERMNHEVSRDEICKIADLLETRHLLITQRTTEPVMSEIRSIFSKAIAQSTSPLDGGPENDGWIAVIQYLRPFLQQPKLGDK